MNGTIQIDHRHNKTTFKLILLWYVGACASAAIGFIVYAAIYRLVTGHIIPNLDYFIVPFWPIYIATLIMVWSKACLSRSYPRIVAKAGE